MLLRRILQIVSWTALAAAILPSCAFLAGQMENDTMNTVMLAATVVWFVATPLWMLQNADDASSS